MGDTNTEPVSASGDAASTAASIWANYGSTLIWVCVIGAVFGFLWYKGYLARFANYVRLTREELRKCSWPTWSELKGHTVVIGFSIALLAGFTVLVDFVLGRVLLLLT